MAATIAIPENALVVLIGAAGSGKSTFAGRWFPPDAIVSSDALRASTPRSGKKRRLDVFEPLLAAVEERLAQGLLAVVDATNTDWMRRSQLLALARRYGTRPVAMVFDVPLEDCLAWNRTRAKPVPPSVVRGQAAQIERDLDRLDLEGFESIYRLQRHPGGPDDTSQSQVTIGQ